VRKVRPIADPARYGFAVGRVRVLETRLLGRSTYERLLDAHSFREQMRILSETTYGSCLEGARTAEEVELGLDGALRDLYKDFLEQANLPEEVIHYFRLMHDYENLRGRLKAEVLGIPAAELLTELGSAPASSFEGSESELTPDMRVAERHVRDRAAGDDGTLDADLIDPAVDAEMYETLARVACGSGSEYLCDMAKLQIDLGNLKAFVRARVKNLPIQQAENLFVDGGTVGMTRFAESYRLPLAEIGRLVVERPGMHGIDPESIVDPARLDLVIDSAIARQLAEARRVPVGPEPVLAYVASRKVEISMVRMLLVGKLAGVDSDTLRARVRNVA
jgi:V/A-type H+-transporting ATPase subunit C